MERLHCVRKCIFPRASRLRLFSWLMLCVIHRVLATEYAGCLQLQSDLNQLCSRRYFLDEKCGGIRICTRGSFIDNIGIKIAPRWKTIRSRSSMEAYRAGHSPVQWTKNTKDVGVIHRHLLTRGNVVHDTICILTQFANSQDTKRTWMWQASKPSQEIWTLPNVPLRSVHSEGACQRR
jgi:hypothetical protein